MNFLKIPFGSAKETSESAPLHVALLLLQSIRLHAIEGDEESHATFQTELQKLESSLREKADPTQMLVIAGSVDQALHAYNASITKFIIQRFDHQVYQGSAQ